MSLLCSSPYVVLLFVVYCASLVHRLSPSSFFPRFSPLLPFFFASLVSSSFGSLCLFFCVFLFLYTFSLPFFFGVRVVRYTCVVSILCTLRRQRWRGSVVVVSPCCPFAARPALSLRKHAGSVCPVTGSVAVFRSERQGAYTLTLTLILTLTLTVRVRVRVIFFPCPSPSGLKLRAEG